LDWQSERYVRLYCRDTATWQRLGFAGQCILMQLLRVLDKDGRVSLGGSEPWRFAAELFDAPEGIAREGMAALLQLGVVEPRDQGLLVPNFQAAQAAAKSGAQRMREYRERQRDTALRNVTEQGSQAPTYTPSNGCHDVTNRNDPLRRVTPRDAGLRNVTVQNGCGTPPYEDDPGQIQLPSPAPWMQLIKVWERVSNKGIPIGDPHSHRARLESLWVACVARDPADPLAVFRRAAEGYCEAQKKRGRVPRLQYFATDFEEYADTYKPNGRRTSPLIEELEATKALQAQALKAGDTGTVDRLDAELRRIGKRMTGHA